MALSGGERRRCEIARALAADPSIMLLDEPFAGIDPLSIGDIRDLVKDLKQRGIGVLITDHNVRETLDIVDRACIIYGGQVLFAGSPGRSGRRTRTSGGCIWARASRSDPPMALGPRLDLRQSQSLVMTPQLQQAIKLLALSNLEIETFIAEELEKNPLLAGAAPRSGERAARARRRSAAGRGRRAGSRRSARSTSIATRTVRPGQSFGPGRAGRRARRDRHVFAARRTARASTSTASPAPTSAWPIIC